MIVESRRSNGLARALKLPAQTLSDKLDPQLRMVGLRPVREYTFHPVRRWRADFAFIDQRLIVECEGGIWQGGKGGGGKKGGHNWGRGFIKDIAKYNALAVLGWRLIRVTGEMIDKGEALQVIEAALAHDPSTPILRP